MVHPAKPHASLVESPALSLSASIVAPTKHRISMMSVPPLVNTRTTYANVDWRDISPNEGDWQHCRRLINKFGHDGRKLDLWRLCLGFYQAKQKANLIEPEDDKGKRREKWTEDEQPVPSAGTSRHSRAHGSART